MGTSIHSRAERLTLGQFGDGDLLTTEETAEVLGVSVHTLSDWRWRNRGPKPTKCGRLVRYFACDLRAFLAAQNTEGTR